jgi:hypothetical protein
MAQWLTMKPLEAMNDDRQRRLQGKLGGEATGSTPVVVSLEFLAPLRYVTI